MKGGVDILRKRKQGEIEKPDEAAAGPAKREHTMLTQAEELAGTKISQWWRARRSSGKSVNFNPTGNHSQAFHLFLNNHKNIPKRLTHFQDQALLEDIKNGDWHSERFQKSNVHYSLMNLFAARKIDWQQKATLSDIIETSRVYGRFIPHCILTEAGEFTEQARTHLLPFLKKSVVFEGQEAFSEDELDDFRKSVMTLPLSERFFFIFPEQKLNEQGSSPSRHSLLRDTFIHRLFDAGLSVIRTMRRQSAKVSQKAFLEYKNAVENNIDEYWQTITTDSHAANLKYEGIVKLSCGAENALGLIDAGLKNWWWMVPRLGKQTIDDIDQLSQHKIRPTLAPESMHLGLVHAREHLHGGWHEYPEIVAHDDFHRKGTAMLGDDIHQGVERIITLARETFGYKWSKDIWLLRDFELYMENRDLKAIDQKEETAYRFASTFFSPYSSDHLENCEEETKEKLKYGHFMMDENKHPRQMALVFVIDLIRNPQVWDEFNILGDEKYYLGLSYEKLIQMAKYLNNKGIFGDSMKDNVIKFSHFIENESFVPTISEDEFLPFGLWDSSDPGIALALEKIKDLETADFEPFRDNKRVFLGFRRIGENVMSPTLDPKASKKNKRCYLSSSNSCMTS